MSSKPRSATITNTVRDEEADAVEAEVRRRADAARRFLGAKTVEQQLAEQRQVILQLVADLRDTRESMARLLAENMRLMQQNDALLWSLDLAHKHYVVKAQKQEA